MAQPITWRNVSAPTPAAEVSNIFEQSRRNLGGAFDSVGGILAGQEAMATRNMNALDEAAKQNYLDQLSGAKTPEELAALQASGTLDAARQGLSVQARAAVRGADEARTTALRANLTAGQKFGIDQQDFADAPGREQVKALQAAGKFADADALTAQLNLRVQSDLLGASRTGAREQVMQGRNDLTFKQGQDDRTFNLPLTRAAALRNETNAIRDDGQKQDDRAFKTPLERAAALRTDRTGVLNQLDAEQAASDKTELRTLETALAGAAQRNAADVTAVSLKQGELAKQLGFPVNASGHADFDNMSPEQRKLFDQGATTLGFPSSTASTTGDTVRANNLYQELSGSGKFSPRVLRANEGAIRGAVTSVAPAPVGNDAFNVALATAQNQVGFDRQDANNWYAPNSPDARRSYEELATKVPDIIKGSTSGLDAAEDVADVQALIGEIGSVGIKRKDGKSVVPSVNDVLRFVRSSEGGWFSDDSRAKNIRKELEKWVNSPEAITMQQDGLKSQSWRDKQKMQQILRDSLNPAPKK